MGSDSLSDSACVQGLLSSRPIRGLVECCPRWNPGLPQPTQYIVLLDGARVNEHEYAADRRMPDVSMTPHTYLILPKTDIQQKTAEFTQYE